MLTPGDNVFVDDPSYFHAAVKSLTDETRRRQQPPPIPTPVGGTPIKR
jgi:hypothetical protein